MNISFLVQGSAAEPYVVSFHKEAQTFMAFCTCPAGDQGQSCKHRRAILEGDITSVIDPAADSLQTVQAWFKGSTIENALQALQLAEQHVATTKAAESKAKKALGFAMRGQ